ncbi:MAG: Cof-type HAD-IIB family hydrolase [Anaerolineae bacterium]|nr:Cof-type HAD-IIB family hydrolase [Anaerolineae bacterium]
MAETPIRLIVADLDGTLLTSEHVVSPFTARMIDEAIASGVLFTVATGKTFASTPELIARFNIQLPVICGNGTQIFNPDGTLLHEQPIPLEYAIEAVQMGEAQGFTPIVYTRDGLLASVRNELVADLVAHHEPEPEIVDDVTTALRNGHKPYKMVMMKQDLDEVAAFQTQLTAAFLGRADVLRSGLLTLVEILPHGINKATALDYVLEHLGIAAEATLALGDNCNDLAMLQHAGIGVAMDHAPQEVRDGADYVTGTNDEDGVGHAVQRFVLSPRAVDAG